MWAMNQQIVEYNVDLGSVLSIEGDNQELQDWVFLVRGHDKLSQMWIRHPKADTITTLKIEDDSLFVFRSEVTIFIMVNDDEWKGK